MKIKKVYFILFIIFLVGNFSILLNMDSFIYLGISDYSDIPITHYPNLLFIQESIINYGQIPLWSNLIFSGYPFSANPLSGLWYFPGWFALLFTLPIGINLTLLFHLLLGMLGMYKFLMKINLSSKSAVFGAIAFTFSAKGFAHIGAGHLSLIYSICWTPWFLHFLLNSFGGKKGVSWIKPGLFLGMMLLADLRWSIPLSLIWLTLIFYDQHPLLKKIKVSFMVFISGLLASIAVWLPLLKLIPFTTRSKLETSDQMIFSMSLVDYLNLFFPVFEGSAELRVYASAIIMLLGVSGIYLVIKNSQWRYWFILLLASLLFSLGDNFLVNDFIYKIPGFSLIRVPGRFGFPMIFALIMIASKSLDDLKNNSIFTDKYGRKLILFSVYIFVLLFAIGTILITQSVTIQVVWPIIIYSIAFFVLIFDKKLNNLHPYYSYLFSLLLFIDLVFVNSQSITFEKADNVLQKNSELMAEIKKDNSLFRVYTPTYSISQEEGAFWKINQINGVDPIQMQNYSELFEKTSGIPIKNYSVTLPPFESGDPKIDNVDYCPDVGLLGDLNTKYVLSSFSLNDCFSVEPKLVSDKFLYKITSLGNYIKFLDCNEGNYEILKYTPNLIEIYVESCGGYLQISEINFPGWRVFLDDVEVEFTPGAILRQVHVPVGEHHIRMIYQPLIVILSAVGQSALWLIALGFIWKNNLEK